MKFEFRSQSFILVDFTNLSDVMNGLRRLSWQWIIAKYEITKQSHVLEMTFVTSLSSFTISLPLQQCFSLNTMWHSVFVLPKILQIWIWLKKLTKSEGLTWNLPRLVNSLINNWFSCSYKTANNVFGLFAIIFFDQGLNS